MTAEITLFNFESHEVRVHIDESGNPWWVLVDVCRVLGINNSRDVVKRLKSDEYDGVDFIDPIGRSQRTTIVNEKGLYRLIFRSNKPEAERFQDWVYGEVLPSIRKTGSYAPQLPEIKNPATKIAIETLMRIDAMEQRQIEQDKAIAKAQQLALEAISAQQWVTIKQYVAIHQMTRQLPPGTEQQQYGRWLSGYCREKNLPTYKSQGEQYPEWTYPVWTIQQTLHAWLARRHGQGNITDLEIGDNGVWYDTTE